MTKITLASASPRRRMLLEAAGVTVVVQPADVDESVLPGEDPLAYAQQIGRAHV